MKQQYNNLIIFNSTKEDGNMSKKFSDDAELNRSNFIKNIGLDVNKFLFMQPDNSDQIVEIKDDILECDNLYGKLIEADALICKYPEVYIYLNFGDCIPFVIYDKKQNIYAFAHLGRRSTILNLHQKLYYIFKEKYNSETEDLIVYIGPCIKKESYLLNTPDVKEIPEWSDFISLIKDDLYAVDLPGYIATFFLKENFDDSQVIVSDVDTGIDENYFSHYRSFQNQDEVEGRFLFGVGMIK